MDPDVLSQVPVTDPCTSASRDATLAFLRELDSVDARWNAAIGRYTRPDGTYDERPTEFREASVSLFSYDDWSLRILVERESSRRVRVRAIIEPHALARSASASVRLRMDGETQTFATLPASDTSFVIDRCVDVAPETTLQLDVDTGVEVRSVRHCP